MFYRRPRTHPVLRLLESRAAFGHVTWPKRVRPPASLGGGLLGRLDRRGGAAPVIALVQRVFLALDRALEMRTALDRDRLVDDVALDLGRGRQPDLQTANPANHPAIHDDIIGDHLAPDRRALADGQQMRAHIALDRALDLDVARG